MTETLVPQPKIYIPPNSVSLDKVSILQIRLGIQGYPGYGKTWSALTFPNPVVLDLDKGLGAHRGKANIIMLPLWDVEFAKKYEVGEPDNLKRVAKKWIEREGKYLTEDQTLVYDGLTGIEAAYHRDWERHPAISARSGKIDDFAEWNLKVAYFNDLFDSFLTLKCNVVFLTHESEKPDAPAKPGEPGEYTGKIRPLMTGQFRDRIVGKCTDWFRQMTAAKPNFKSLTEDQKTNIQKNWQMSVDEFKAFCDTFPNDIIYYWQTMSDAVFDAKSSSLVNQPRCMPANYQTFIKYLRK